MGALCGDGLSADIEAGLDAYAKAVGLAFQVVDDILDVTADSATLGKTAGKDAANDKPTYVSIIGLQASRELAAQLRRDAHAALAPLGERGLRLAQIADLVVERMN
jgi:farnesyl diphosphate synthase